jgi:hypothetical protein
VHVTWASLPPIPHGHTANVVLVVLGGHAEYSLEFLWFVNGQAFVTLWSGPPEAERAKRLARRSHFTARRAAMTVPLGNLPRLGPTFAWTATMGIPERGDFARCPVHGRTILFPRSTA